MGINTGTPGFDIDGKVYTYDVGDPNRTPQPPVAVDKGDMTVDQNDPPTKDLDKPTKITLGTYLGRQTKINYISIDEGYTSTSIIVPEKPNETPPIPSPLETTKNSEWYTKGKTSIDGTTKYSTTLSNWRRGRQDTLFPELSPILPDASVAGLNKGKTTPSAPDTLSGNELLSSIDKPNSLKPTLGKIGSYTDILLNNNRFTSTNNYVPKTNDISPEERSPAAQTSYLDDIALNGNYNPTLNHPVYGNITAGKMAQVGTLLSVRASGEHTKNNVTSLSSFSGPILPGNAQIGGKIELAKLQASDVLKSLEDVEIPEEQYVDISNGSWGSLNNVYDSFSGLTSSGMMILSAILSLSVGSAITALGSVLSLAKNDYTRIPTVGVYYYGRSTAPPPNNLQFEGGIFDAGTAIGLKDTRKPYLDAVLKGLEIYFIPTDGRRLLDSSTGHNVVLLRTILRSSVTIFEAVKQAARSSGLISTIQNVLSIVDLLKSSKIISALNVFATLGDSVLRDFNNDPISGLTNKDLDSVNELYNELYNEGLLKSHSTERLITTINGEKSKKLAWASNRAPSLYLVPSSIKLLSNDYKNFGSIQSFTSNDAYTRSKIFNDEIANSKKEGTTDRIPVERLTKLENELEAEYVPFYFQDIRTNEVIGFHAFLESLSDDFTANYDSVDGFGRVEPVRIYKGTQRKISMSFIIAATSKLDFEDMWVKINKLTTLVYPQYTEGRRKQVGGDTFNYKFVQPFSQMIGASPLIRIRLGNLIRGNYSRFALARLFGATLPDTNFSSIGEKTIRRRDFTDKGQEKYIERVQNLKFKSGTQPWTYIGSQPGTASYSGTNYSRIIPLRSLGQKIKNNYIQVEYMPFEEVPYEYWLQLDKQYSIEFIKSEYEVATGHVRNLQFPIHIDEIKPSVILQNQILASGEFTRTIEIGTEPVEIDELSNFMSSENNALVKSFKSASGKGLAGFIDSMSFDWQDRRWDIDEKAPMMCKVNISFAPIHDITPGLDSQGYNRAPVYPVGPLKPGRRDGDLQGDLQGDVPITMTNNIG